MKVKILSNEENKCPYCNCEDFYHISDDFFKGWDGTTIVRTMECRSCLRVFEQRFKLQFISNFVGEDKDISARDALGEEIDYEEEE